MPTDSAAPSARESRQFARAIIGRVSRTFAFGIRALPGSLGRSVLTGYLLCRIADTIEDDGACPAPARQALLAQFLTCFEKPETTAEFVRDAAVIRGAEADLELVAGTANVIALLRQLPPSNASIVEHWTRELVRGMIEFVGKYPAGIRIQTMDEYRRYCYFVAGTVGHLLTELWRAHVPSMHERVYRVLLAHCEAFGEALQTINILKDIAWDIEHENAAYVPEELLRRCGSSHASMLSSDRTTQNHEAIGALVELAKKDLALALEYIQALPKIAPAIRFFCLLPVLLAVATLREIERSTAMLQSGGVVKIARGEVRALIVAASMATMSNRYADRIVRRIGVRRFRFA